MEREEEARREMVLFGGNLCNPIMSIMLNNVTNAPLFSISKRKSHKKILERSG